jgi:hypothetical protein
MNFSAIFPRNCAPLALFIMTALLGCSNGPARPAVYKVNGKVTMNGSPLAGASVFFSPKGKQPIAMGRTNDQGEYILTTYSAGDGAAAGDYVVLVSKEAANAPAKMSHGVDVKPGLQPIAHDAKRPNSSSSGLLPEKYGNAKLSGLTATVKAGGPNQFLQELTP